MSYLMKKLMKPAHPHATTPDGNIAAMRQARVKWFGPL